MPLVTITDQPAPVTWTLRTPAGSVADYSLTLALENGEPYPVEGASFEYVVRVSSNSTGTPVFVVTTTPSAAGLITVTTSPATVIGLTLYPAATEALSGTYRHSLWSNSGTPGAFSWIVGNLSVSPTPQP